MSKRLDKSKETKTLPDWADDVTPDEEVMKKFYAPTGSFRSGPIAPPSIDEPALQSGTSDPVNTVPSLPPAEEKPLIDKGLEAVVAEPQLPGPEPDSTVQFPSPPQQDEPNITAIEPVEVAQTSSPVRRAERSDQTISFEDFARRWNRFLYTGQMSVMRELYALTIPFGTSECFTRYSELASRTRMSRRNCINVVNSLVTGGFVERVEIKNDASGKGIRLRIYLEPSL
jgi:hypothetical protein